ncbi:hypothetical protein BDR05DRAFT_943313 [Suillus weaverae]|nr:hypothetical protein BDR05DRAFT_943313 [Suillus weaverae]
METISLEILAVQEGGNKRKGSHGVGFGNICEGKKDINARINAPCLVVLALDTIGPKIEAFAPGFPWWQDKFLVHDGAWVDLATHPADVPYFYLQCLHPSRKGWDDYESWLNKVKEEDLNYHHGPSTSNADHLRHNAQATNPSTTILTVLSIISSASRSH